MKFLALILSLGFYSGFALSGSRFAPFQLQVPQLPAIKNTLMSLRENLDDHRPTKGAAPELTTAKHQLREWVESQLAIFSQTGDTRDFAQHLRDQLDAAKLYCVDEDHDCFENGLGFLEDIEVTREREFLIVRTAVSVFCGFDYSAYVYAWRAGKWDRIWENEQNTYTPKDYAPQVIQAVHISDPDKDGNRLILTLGIPGGCVPGYLPIYYRVWQIKPDFSASKLVLDAKETVLDGYPPVHGKVGPDDVLIEFTVGGIAYGENHKAVRHFEIRNQRAQQVDPVATTPRDFVEEWISGDWGQSGPRSASAALQQSHMKMHRTDGVGDFPDPAVRCKTGADLWQIGTHYHEGPKTYYLVRWTPPYKFTMMDVKDRPFADCTVPDPKGDLHPALFDQN